MFEVFSGVVGGIGLFLLGMILMTDGLKSLAGDALRGVLTRYTANRYSACAAGAGITALVQSSSATTVATIGFVSAGLLPFQNAVGVIIGAALGTTSTGWIVSLLGLKLSVGTIMLPFIGLGALARLVTRGKPAQIGTIIAGFGVIFVGIGELQEGMEGLAKQFDPSNWPQATIGGRVLLVLIGVAMTVVMQSSSAAVATTLAALAGGAIDVQQAAALVIGQSIGTTITSAIASIGGTTAAKRTAIAHFGFTLVTGIIAFALLPVLTWAVLDLLSEAVADDHALTIAAFHTTFNLIGVLIFLPFIPRYAAFIEKYIKLKGPRLTQHLGKSLLQVPTVALAAVRNVLKETAATLFSTLRDMLRGEARWTAEKELEEIALALEEARRFHAKIPPASESDYEFNRQISTLHALDHLERLAADIGDRRALETARRKSALQPACEEVADMLKDLAASLRDPAIEPDASRAQQFSLRLADERRSARPFILEETAAHKLNPDAALAQLRAQRWLDRIAYHIWRSTHHLREMTRKEAAEAGKESSAADAGQPGPSSET